MEAQAPGRPSPPAWQPSRPRSWLPWAALYLLAATVVVALEHLWRGQSYWNFSEGVYLATARAVADGAELYSGVVAAQPPPLFYLGAGLIELSGSLLFVRGSLAVTTVVTGALVALVVGRLTGRRAVAVAAGLAALLVPWTIREHATLTPDPLAAAPLLAAALLAARPGALAGAAAGALAALGASLKLSFVLPAAAVLLVARRRGAYAGGAVVAGGALAAVTFAAWGSPVWDNLITAQRETGFQFGALPGLIAQTIWNLGPLVLLAGLAYLGRARARDPALFRTVLALLLGSLALVATFVKDGTYLNTLVAAEPVAVALAVTGLLWFLEDRSLLQRRRRAASLAAALACAAVAVQSAIVLLFPQDPMGFGNPFLSRAPGYELSEGQVEGAAAAARRCPAGATYSGSPFVAFVAGRPVPAGQPDRFIVGEAEVHSGRQAEIERAGPLCPYTTLGGLPEGGNARAPLK